MAMECPVGAKAACRRNKGAWPLLIVGSLDRRNTLGKSLLFMFTFLPLFVDPNAGPVWLQLLVLGSIQKLIGVFSLGGVALASGSVGHFLNRWPKLLAWQERFTGIVMVGLGIRLLFSGSPSPAPSAAK
jgi:hypothetical protein